MVHQVYFIHLSFQIFIFSKAKKKLTFQFPTSLFFPLSDLTDYCYIIIIFFFEEGRKRNSIFVAMYGLTWCEINRLWARGAMRVRCTCVRTRGGHASTRVLPAYAGSATVISGPSCAATHTHGPRYAYVHEADYATAVQLRASRVDCNATARRLASSNSQPTTLSPLPRTTFNRSLAIHKRGNNPDNAGQNFAIVEASRSAQRDVIFVTYFTYSQSDGSKQPRWNRR